VLIAGALVALLARPNANTTSAPAGWQLVAATTGPIAATIDVTGVIESRSSAELRFAREGTISNVLVQVGDTIKAGTPLARINDTELKLRLAQAQAEVQQAQADYAQAQSLATPAQIAAAQARVEQAQAQYTQARGRVTPADIAAAKARLEQAQAKLDRLQAGPATTDITRAHEGVQRAQSTLEQARTDLAAQKEGALRDVETRANALRNAQDAYSRIFWENKQLDELPGDLPQENKDREAQALRTVQDTESNLNQSKIAYQQAKQNEITTLATREAELQTAQAELERVIRGPLAEDLADARAEVERAEAALVQLQGANRKGELDALTAGVAAAQAELERLTADPTASALQRAQAGVTKAVLLVQQAELALAQATLTAPFDATITRIAMRVGESSSQASMIAIADLSQLLVVADVDELDVAQLQLGQAVQVTIDALPNAKLTGTIAAIAPTATRTANGSNTYRIQVALTRTDVPVKPGMTSAIRVITSQKANVVLVPRRAIINQGANNYVRLPHPNADAIAENGEPSYQRRNITIGLSNSEFSEIVAGLTAGEQVYVQDTATTKEIR
jgi:HlyD family secretion protein